jgi:hypothetical protein
MSPFVPIGLYWTLGVLSPLLAFISPLSTLLGDFCARVKVWARRLVHYLSLSLWRGCSSDL